MTARIITGLLLAAGAILLLSLAPAVWTYVLLQVAAPIMADEFYRMTLGKDANGARYTGIVALAGVVAVVWWAPAWILPVMILTVPLLLMSVLFTDAEVEVMGPRAGMLLAGYAYLGLPLVALTTITALTGKFVGPHMLLCLFAAVFAGDSGAFFSGKAFGNKKLYPKISPKKTWAGAYGGLVASVLGFFLIATIGKVDVTIVEGLILAVGCGIFGQIGDLSESLFKRAYGVKDSGNLLPGHGGLLDRVDGILFGGPFMFAVLHVIA